MPARKRGADRPFVKSADTAASPANSRAEIERMLERYGAVGFGYQRNIEAGTIVVQFIVPDRPGKAEPRVPVTLPVSIRRVYDALYGQTKKWVTVDGKGRYQHDPKGYDEEKFAQAERVAWRNLVLWIDAALSAAAIGLQTITEAFLAHTMVVGDDGRAERMADYLGRTHGALAPGVRALLPPPEA